MSEQISLASLITPSKTVEIPFPGFPDFKVSLCFLAREELLKLRKRCLTTKFDRKSRQPVEELDEDRFLVEYVKAVIKGWSGLKMSILETLILIDSENLDPNDELQYSQENAEILMKNSSDFDTWVTEVVGDLENFTKNRSN